MAVADRTLQILPGGQSAAPFSYVLPASTSFTLLGVRATFDGTAAGSAFLPCVQLVSDAGIVMAQAVGSSVAAGGSADVTFAPFLDDLNATTGGGYDTIQDEGVPLAQETTLDFVGAGVTATDDAGNSRTVVTIPGATVIAGVFATPIFGIAPNQIVSFGISNLYATRFVVPTTGTLAGLALFVGTPSGNFNLAVYDTSAVTRNLLYSSGNVTTGGLNNVWIDFANPALAVTKGDHIDLAVVADNNLVTGSFVPMGSGNPFSGPLPTGYLVSPLGGTPLMGWVKLATAVPPATLLEAGLGPWANVPLILARIT